MQSVLRSIWTRITVSISYDDNHYTTGTTYVSIIVNDVTRFLSTSWLEMLNIHGLETN